MELAIASGNPGAVATLLGTLDKASAVSQLTGCYGGRYFGGRGAQWDADGNGLVSMTNPFLHAARAGSTAVFEAVVSAMKDRLRIQQVEAAVCCALAGVGRCGVCASEHTSKYIDARCLQLWSMLSCESRAAESVVEAPSTVVKPGTHNTLQAAPSGKRTGVRAEARIPASRAAAARARHCFSQAAQSCCST